MTPEPVTTRAVIVGTGFSGLGMAIELKRQGIDDFVVLEKADDVGGTWRDNTYPGCACDVPTHLYSYSFEPRTNWSTLFSYQPEILQYLREVADKYDVRRHIEFGATFAGARWGDDGRWHISTTDGREFVSQFFISGIGALHMPSIPQFPGADEFQGVSFHSAQWNHDYDLTGKNVAVIGTGASAIQFVPRIVDQVGSLQVYQRTPPWVLPRSNVELGTRFQRALAVVPGLRRALRGGLYWFAESGAYGLTRRPAMLGLIERMARQNLEREIADPVLRAKLTPDYRAGCKRLLGSDTYYAAMSQPKTEVITDRIERVTANGIVTADGVERPVDAIIYGTGFHVTDVFEKMALVGREGIDIAQRFRTEGVQAHLGITVADAPNAFFLLGPNTGLGHTSIVFMIESQIRYVSQAIGLTEHQGVDAMVVRREVQDAFNEQIQSELERSVWNSGGCQSWYLDEHGKNRTLWSGFTWQYWLRTRTVAESDFELFTVDRPSVRRPGVAGPPPQRSVEPEPALQA